MKPSKLIVRLRRLSVARGSFIIASCAAAVAVALAAPQSANSGSSRIASAKDGKAPSGASPQGAGILPPSQSKFTRVMVELDAPPASAIYAEAYKAALQQADNEEQARQVPLASATKGVLPKVTIDAAATARVKNQVATIDAAQKSLLPAFASAGAKVMYRTQRAYNGIAISVSPDKIADIAKLPGVKAVRPMIPKHRTAFTSVDFLGTRTFWTKETKNGVGIHGEGVKVAVIDTGLDYVHTNFGGPGTKQAYSVTQDKDPVPNPYFPSQKVPFGYDFAGDAYDADFNDDEHAASPDPNPMDTNGHGTACASVVGGLGMNFGGATYQGNYDADAPDLSTLKIAPGMAPAAQIVPVRIFGTNGTTLLTTEGIDFAMDPNGDGDFSDHVDIISMSLGSNNGTPDDDSAVAASNAVAAGVVVVCSAGNANDTYYITGSPGSATGALATAASFNNESGFIANANVTIHKPSSYAGSQIYAVYGSPCPHVGKKGLRDDVVEARPVNGGDTNSDGSTNAEPLDNADAMQGKICLIDRGSSTFYQKALRAQKSGAVAVVIVNQNHPNEDPIVAGLTIPAGEDNPAISIPVVMIARTQDVDDYRSACAFDPTTGVPQNPEGSNVTIDNNNQLVQSGTPKPDTMASYSSRGPQIGTNALKPDLTAPAEVVDVASAQTGTEVRLHNGTSSACPHVSGGMALARQLHPKWSVQELNALMMNTAIQNLYTSQSHTTRVGVSRVGAGRVDFDNLSKSNVVIFNSTDPATVSVSFGSVEVPVDGNVELSKNVTIRNKSKNDITYHGEIEMVNTVGDASFSPMSADVQVRKGQDLTFPLVFTATGNTLKKTHDPSVSQVQSTNFGNFYRDWIAEAAGYAVFTPTTTGNGATTIRIPLYATVKPVSAMHATTDAFTPANENGTVDVQLSGVGINTGGSALSGGIISVVKALELQYASPMAGAVDAPNDPDIIKYVGIATDYSSYDGDDHSPTTVTFGIEGFGDSTLPSYPASDKEINIDLDHDGNADFVLYPDSIRTDSSQNTHTNVYYSHLVNVHSGSGFYEYPTNLYVPGQLDVNAFNNSTILMSMDARDLGYTGAGQSDFDYWVETFDHNTGALKDRTPTMHNDLAKPGFNAANGGFEPFYDADLPGNSISVNYNAENIQTNNSLGILLLHRHNGQGHRSDVITVTKPNLTNFSPRQGHVGTSVTITGTDFDANTVVRFAPGLAAETNFISSTTLTATVPQGAQTGKITVMNAFGSDQSKKPFTVTAQ